MPDIKLTYYQDHCLEKIMSNKRKILGFVGIMIVLFLVMQTASFISKKTQTKEKTTIKLGAGAIFMPQTEPEKHKAEINKTKQTVQPEKIQKPAKKNNELKENSSEIQKQRIQEIPEKMQTMSPNQELQKANPTQKNNTIAKSIDKLKTQSSPKTKGKTFSDRIPPTESENNKSISENDAYLKENVSLSVHKNVTIDSKTPGTVSLSNASFVELDQHRDQIIKDAQYFNKEVEGKYGWGILSDYENPDDAHQLLGGIPFAIDEKEKRYFRIYIDENKVQSAMGISAYGTTGVDANDPDLNKIVRKAVQSGNIIANTNQLSYFYLFSLDTERYIISKVISAFEWYIAKNKMDEKQSLNFRQEARLRIAVWKATRPKGGVLGTVIPVFFSYQGKEIYFPETYYHQDKEAVALGFSSGQSKY